MWVLVLAAYAGAATHRSTPAAQNDARTLIGSGLYPRGKAEQREHALGVEEEGQLFDRAVGGELDDLKSPRVVTAAGLARLVLAEGNLAVGVGSRQQLRAAAADPRTPPPGEDVLAALQPQVERWHRLPRVLGDQRRQGIDVVALERFDVARQQLSLVALDVRRYLAR